MALADRTPFQAAVTYNAAADHYDREALGFWHRHGRTTVDLLELPAGAHVLDVGCGTGASALPAAVRVGREGRVLGIDIAEKMLDRARTNAARSGLKNVAFRLEDMSERRFPASHFDAVVSVFSLFFAEDMKPLLADLWRTVRPGGQLAVTSWGRNAFRPCAAILYEEVRSLDPSASTGIRPWERLEDETAIRHLFVQAGVSAPEIYSVPDEQLLSCSEDWWTIALGSGFRADIERFEPTDRERLRRAVTQRVSTTRIAKIETSALIAIARKPI